MVVMSSNGQPINITSASINSIAMQGDKQQIQLQQIKQPTAFLQQVREPFRVLVELHLTQVLFFSALAKRPASNFAPESAANHAAANAIAANSNPVADRV